MKYLFYLLISISTTIFFGNVSHASIDLNVSPIKYEITAGTGETITRTAKLINSSNDSFTILTGKSDFESNGPSGVPHFVRRSELVFPDQQLSSWITIDTPSFVIGPSETKEVNFTIDIPSNATPGGHYGAVFFKNNNSETGTSGQVGINVDYGIIILLNVDGTITASGSVQPIVITTTSGGGGGGSGGGWGSGGSNILEDDCPLGDLTASNFDGKCIDNIFSNTDENTDNNGSSEENTLSGSHSEIIDSPNKENTETEPFEVTFEVPFENTGNVHIKPSGNIVLTDEDGNILPSIGKEIVTNNQGVVIGEKIVDYLPINDIGGNVLPSTTREFDSEWKGFPYKDYDEAGNPVIKYWSPGEYYTQKNVEQRGFLMFWERVCERKQHKTITANFDIAYTDEKGKEITFNSAKEFNIEYKEKYIGLNPYVLIPLALLIFMGCFFWFLLGLKKKPCTNKKCKKKINRKMKICPYCEKKQSSIKTKKKKS